MAKTVVDDFKVIEINEQNSCQLGGMPLNTVDYRFQTIQEENTVRQACKLVMACILKKMLFPPFPLRWFSKFLTKHSKYNQVPSECRRRNSTATCCPFSVLSVAASLGRSSRCTSSPRFTPKKDSLSRPRAVFT